MLHATAHAPQILYGCLGCGLGFGASVDVKELQQALIAFAQAKRVPMANPGPADGIMGPQTRQAVLAVLPHVPKIPSAVKKVLEIGGIAAAVVPQAAEQADQLIAQYAKEIAIAVKAVTALGSSSATSATSSGSGWNVSAALKKAATTVMKPAAPVPMAQPWYGTTGGKAALGVGALAIVGSALALALR